MFDAEKRETISEVPGFGGKAAEELKKVSGGANPQRNKRHHEGSLHLDCLATLFLSPYCHSRSV